MDSARKIASDDELRVIAAAGTGFIIDPFNRRWHLVTCPHIDKMTIGQPKWFARSPAALDEFLERRLTQYPTAKRILACTSCSGPASPAPADAEASTRLEAADFPGAEPGSHRYCQRCGYPFQVPSKQEVCPELDACYRRLTDPTYRVPAGRLAEVEERVREHLIGRAQAADPVRPMRATVTYGELCKAVDPDGRYWTWPRFRGIGRVLLRISGYEHGHGRPLLSALVVRAADRRAGEGFAVLARDLGYQIDEGAERIFWRSQVDQVVRYWAETPGRAAGSADHGQGPSSMVGITGVRSPAEGELEGFGTRATEGISGRPAESALSEPSGPTRAVVTEGRGLFRMAPTLYRDTGYTLAHLIEDIKHANIALPDIQRPFVWSAAKTRDLFDSLYRGYPVGTLMFWETGADVGTRQLGSDSSGDRVPKLLVVDGQQRLTSLFAVLTGSTVVTKTFEERRIRLGFRPLDETFEVTDAAIERDPEFVPDITALWEQGYKSTVRAFLHRLAENRGTGLGDAEQDLLEERIDRVRDLRDFRFQVIELGTGANEEQVADIFVRINSEGVQLNQADFIMTLMSVHWEKGRRELEQFCRAAVDPAVAGASPRNAFIDPSPDQLLRVGVGHAFRRGRLQHVYSLLRGKDLDTGAVSPERRAAQFDRLRRAQEDVLDLSNWHEYLTCLTAAGFRGRRMITSENAVIFTYALWLIGRCDFGLDLKTLRGVISRWFFMAHTTGRYTTSPESQLEADLTRLSGPDVPDGSAFCAELDRIVRANFTGDYWDISLPNRLDTSSSRSPALSAYWAALNLLDAELLFSDIPVKDLLDKRSPVPRAIERHHLFPKAFLAKRNITNPRQVNAIANMAFADWPDSAAIGSDDPMAYWPAMTEYISAERVKNQAYWHALPVGWEQLDYPRFLERRRQLIARVTQDGFARLWGDKQTVRRASAADLVAAGESQTLEFKSTARWNLRTGATDKKLEHVIAKTVCAFFNAEGGTLLIGIEDSGNAIGLDNDFRSLGPRGNRDGYELYLRQMLDNSLSIPTAGLLRIRFETFHGRDVCLVSVAAAGRPVFARAVESGQGPSEFWVRVGNASKQLHGDDMVQYQAIHW